MTEPAVQVKNVSVVLGGYYPALKNIRVDLPPAQIIGFIGPSGAGKTTLIRSIVGRQKIQKGTITVFGMPAGAAGLREHIRYMTQELSIYPDLTVYENMAYFASMLGLHKKAAKPIIADVIKTVGLTDHTNQLVSKLSGGQKQRASLAISFIGSPKLMVLDEPTVGLDPVLREELWVLFRQLATAGTTLIISSHVMDEAERCDDLLLIRDGKLIAHGSPAMLKKQTGTASVEQSFLKLVEAKA